MAKPTVSAEEVKKEVHRKVWAMLVELEWAKGEERKLLLARYQAFKEIWDFLGGDTPEEGEVKMNVYKLTVLPYFIKGIANIYTIEAEDMGDAVEQGEEYGTVVKAVLDE